LLEEEEEGRREDVKHPTEGKAQTEGKDTGTDYLYSNPTMSECNQEPIL